MQLSTMLTFGLWPLFRKLLGAKDDDFVICDSEIMVYMEQFGVPSEEKFLKVVGKHLPLELAERFMDGVTGHGWSPVPDRKTAEMLERDLERAGFPIVEFMIVRLEPPLVMTLGPIGSRQLIRYAICKSGCGATSVRGHWTDLPTCNKCGGTDVINPTTMTREEMYRHVKNYEALSRKWGKGDKQPKSDGGKRPAEEIFKLLDD